VRPIVVKKLVIQVLIAVFRIDLRYTMYSIKEIYYTIQGEGVHTDGDLQVLRYRLLGY